MEENSNLTGKIITTSQIGFYMDPDKVGKRMVELAIEKGPKQMGALDLLGLTELTNETKGDLQELWPINIEELDTRAINHFGANISKILDLNMIFFTPNSLEMCVELGKLAKDANFTPGLIPYDGPQPTNGDEIDFMFTHWAILAKAIVLTNK